MIMADLSGLCTDLEEHKQEIEDGLRENGPEHFVDSVRRSLDKWKETPLNIGVTGRSGVGKSTIINTIRGLTGECSGAASTGATETTLEAMPYPHPKNKNLILWDLPGIGTENFSKGTYFTDKRVQFDKYDMFLIISSDRFFEDDILLAATAQGKKKLFLFIRSKVDLSVYSESRAKPKQFKDPNATQKLLGQIRGEVVEGLRENKLPTEDTVFLIDCQDWHEYDFGKLIGRVIDGFSGLKRESFILTLDFQEAEFLEQKVAVLRKRIWKMSTLSAAGAFVPVPGLSMAVDSGIILEETLFYMKQLGISKKDIEKAAMKCSMDPKEFQAKVHIKTAVLSWAIQGMATIMSEIAASEVAENLAKIAIPFLGNVFASAASFASIYYILTKTLNTMESDAKKLHTYLLEYARSI